MAGRIVLDAEVAYGPGGRIVEAETTDADRGLAMRGHGAALFEDDRRDFTA